MILRRNFLRTFLVTPFLGFFNGRKPETSLEIPEPPYPYAFGETYSQAGIELQISLDRESWEPAGFFKVGEVMHVQVGELDVIPQNYRYLRMVVKNVDLKGGVITLAGVNDGNDARQLDPYDSHHWENKRAGKYWGVDPAEGVSRGVVSWVEV